MNPEMNQRGNLCAENTTNGAIEENVEKFLEKMQTCKVTAFFPGSFCTRPDPIPCHALKGDYTRIPIVTDQGVSINDSPHLRAISVILKPMPTTYQRWIRHMSKCSYQSVKSASFQPLVPNPRQ
jgi:hypothetical protein